MSENYRLAKRVLDLESVRRIGVGAEADIAIIVLTIRANPAFTTRQSAPVVPGGRPELAALFRASECILRNDLLLNVDLAAPRHEASR